MPKRKKSNIKKKTKKVAKKIRIEVLTQKNDIPQIGNPNIDKDEKCQSHRTYVNNEYDYEYTTDNLKNALELLEQEESVNYGKVIKSPGELRKHANDEDHVIGSQGQIMANFGAQKYLLGTGFMVSFSNAHQTEKSTQMETKQFIMTSSQIFKRIDSSRNQQLIAQSAVFSLGLNIDADGIFRIDCQTALNEYYDDPEYYSNQFTFNPFHDIALAVCDIKNEMNVKTKNIKMADVSIAKPGDRICLAGYPAEYNGKLYYMEGSIRGIYYNDREDSAIITYNDINVSHGMNGSPVYLKMDDESWVVIGVHVAYDKKNNVNIATALTKSKKDRLNAIANSYFHKPSQNLIYSPRVRKIGREASVVQVPMNILTNKKNPKYRLRGCQGQLITNFESGARLLGSGLFLNVSFDNANGKKDQESEIWFVLTCGHLLLYSQDASTLIQYPQTSVFSYGTIMAENEDSYSKDILCKDILYILYRRLVAKAETHLNQFYVYPEFLEKFFIPDANTNLAIACCESNLKGDWEMKDIEFETVDNAKEGDTIRVMHFSSQRPFVKKTPSELIYADITINEIKYENNGDDAIITYSNSFFDREMIGSPVFLRKTKDSWAIIGFQTNKDRGSTLAVGLTKNKLQWLNEIVMNHINSVKRA